MKLKVLTNAQARELKFFCANILGTRLDYYAVMSKANEFDERLKRLEKTARMVEEYLGEKIEPLYQTSVFDQAKDQT
jgi:hypothetical protein